MRSLFRTGLVLFAAAALVYGVATNWQRLGLDKFNLPGIARPASGEFDALAGGETIRIASFNIQAFGHTKLDKPQVMEKLVSVVGSARTSIRFLAFTYTHQDLAEAMIARHSAGVDVAGIFENRASTQGAMVPLYCAGVPVKVDGNRYTMHHKVIIIDERIVITGSFNFTVSADDSNDDNLLVISSPALAQLYLQEYQRLDSIAEPPDTTSDNFKEAQAEKCQ